MSPVVYLVASVALCIGCASSSQSSAQSAPAPAASSNEGAELFYGAGYSFMLESAPGWSCACGDAAPEGVEGLFAPTTGDAAQPVVLVTVSPRDETTAPAEFLRSEIARAKEDAGGTALVNDEAPVTLTDGRTITLETVARPDGARVTLAFVPESSVFVGVILSADDENAYRVGSVALRKILASYRFVSKDVSIP